MVSLVQNIDFDAYINLCATLCLTANNPATKCLVRLKFCGYNARLPHEELSKCHACILFQYIDRHYLTQVIINLFKRFRKCFRITSKRLTFLNSYWYEE